MGQLVHIIRKPDSLLGCRDRQVKELDVELCGLVLQSRSFKVGFRFGPEFCGLERPNAGDMGILVGTVSDGTGYLLGKLEAISGAQSMVSILDRSFARIGIDGEVFGFFVVCFWLSGWASRWGGGFSGGGGRLLLALFCRRRCPGRRRSSHGR